MGDYWIWVQRAGEAITVLGLGLHALRKIRKEIGKLSEMIDHLAAIPSLTERVRTVETSFASHVADGHGPQKETQMGATQPSQS